jgi:hypothetical protein
MIYLCTKFSTPNSNASLVIAVKPEVKEKFPTLTMHLFYILQNISTRVTCFTNIYHHISYQNLKLKGASITPTS